jgi:hypothetical protein
VFVVGLVLAMVEAAKHILSHLVEFQTPTIFNSD